LPDIVRALPLERLLVETDCPFLAPHPHRGKRNEPAYVRLVAERIAELRNMSLDDLAAVTTTNARRLFKFEARGPTFDVSQTATGSEARTWNARHPTSNSKRK
jgi:hypothetical protein